MKRGGDLLQLFTRVGILQPMNPTEQAGNREPNTVPYTIYTFAVFYLQATGWYRDGDDRGIWHQGGGINPPGLTWGDAMMTQLEADGIDFAWTT